MKTRKKNTLTWSELGSFDLENSYTIIADAIKENKHAFDSFSINESMIELFRFNDSLRNNHLLFKNLRKRKGKYIKRGNTGFYNRLAMI